MNCKRHEKGNKKSFIATRSNNSEKIISFTKLLNNFQVNYTKNSYEDSKDLHFISYQLKI